MGNNKGKDIFLNDVCPVCNGTGIYCLPQKMSIDVLEIKRKILLDLRSKGYSIRQIQRALGYKSPHSVHLIIEQHKTKK
jgi:acetoacetate decarboxylase